MPVVEIEEHRRALRGGAEQVAELAEHVRPDRVALVLGEQEAVAALARVDVEVVEPEVGQHFLELPLAVDRAQHLLLGSSTHHAVGALLHRVRRRLAVRSARSSPLARPASSAAARLELRDLVLLRDLPRAQAERRQPGEPRGHRRVGDPLRVELLVDVALRGPVAGHASTSPGRGPKPMRLST